MQGVAVFVEAAEAGSFALAANRLRVTRSAVAKRIARLEQRLGARLFHRTTRQQTLTESGQAYYEFCKRALIELDNAEASLDRAGGDPRGRLRVSVPVLLGQRCVAPILSKLVHHYPHLELEMSFSDRVVDMLNEGFDLAIRIGALKDSSSLAARRLGNQQFHIYAAPAYLQRRGMPEYFADYAQHDAIVYADQGPESPWEALDVDGSRHELSVKRKIRFNDVQAIANAAVQGLGLARLPSWLAEPLVAENALTLVFDKTPVAADVHAVWPASRFLPGKTRLAIDTLIAQLPAMLNTSRE